MALVKKKSNSTRVFIIAAVIVGLAVIGYFLVPRLFESKNASNLNTLPLGRQPIITDFGESILNDPRFKELKPFNVNLDVNANRDAGQRNPFQ